MLRQLIIQHWYIGTILGLAIIGIGLGTIVGTRWLIASRDNYAAERQRFLPSSVIQVLDGIFAIITVGMSFVNGMACGLGMMIILATVSGNYPIPLWMWKWLLPSLTAPCAIAAMYLIRRPQKRRKRRTDWFNRT